MHFDASQYIPFIISQKEAQHFLFKLIQEGVLYWYHLLQ